MIDLTGKTAVVTGGSRGIGAAATRLLARAGARVLFTYRRQAAAAAKLAAGCRREGLEAAAFRADLSRVAEARALMARAAKVFGRLDVLVANAGIWNPASLPIEKMSERDWDEMMDVNMKSVYAAARFAVPLMKRRKSGRIIVVSSTAGQRGEAFHTHYGASKGAAISFVKGLSTELAPHNILVNCVAPGWVDTDMSRPVLSDARARRKIDSTIPLGRVATAEEVAGPIVFLASDLASFITGEVLNVNGGSVLAG